MAEHAIFWRPRNASQYKRLAVLGTLSVSWLVLAACTAMPAPTVPTNPRIVVPSTGSMVVPLPPFSHGHAEPAAEFFSLGSEAVVRAIALLGTPYEFGGNGPDTFDCSGLVRYVYQELGFVVPRTALEQYHAAIAVDLDHLEPGDLLFFRTQGQDVSHVAIYAGSGRFVHAPQTGRVIELRTLDDAYFRQRLVGAGRLFSKTTPAD
jgi:cell wall-associated NlpC family hydrolase